MFGGGCTTIVLGLSGMKNHNPARVRGIPQIQQNIIVPSSVNWAIPKPITNAKQAIPRPCLTPIFVAMIS